MTTLDTSMIVALAAAPAGAEPALTLWDLFAQSFDVFTITLLAGSMLAVTLVVRRWFELRPGRLDPADERAKLFSLARDRRPRELVGALTDGRGLTAAIAHQALSARVESADAAREALEYAAEDVSASLHRRVEPLQLIGQLAPLVGLAGTVWGMIIAFASLGEAGGRATPGDLSGGIAKALFHTLLGLIVAIPSLAALGMFRLRIERAIGDAAREAGRLLPMAPDKAAEQLAAADRAADTGPAFKPAKRGGKA